MSRDGPSDDLDNESLDAYFDDDIIICNNQPPVSIEARVIDTMADYKTTHQNVIIHPLFGFICDNNQNDRRCENYEVRFCCVQSESINILYTFLFAFSIEISGYILFLIHLVDFKR